MSSAGIDAAVGVDVGPLSWVQGEIDQALTRGLDALAQFAADTEPTLLKHAQTHIHEAAGAIQMVGLDALVAFTDEIERSLAHIEEPDRTDIAASCDAVDRALRRLKIFLGELLDGAPLLALRLLPEYGAMQRARGVQAISAADLFFPDLSLRPALSDTLQHSAGASASNLVAQRRLFQRGLLSWLHGNREGANDMREAVAGIEHASASQTTRSFWWTVRALLDSLSARGLETDVAVKQLIARVDVQIRRLTEGSSKVADRLRREVLYHIAVSKPVTPLIADVQRTYSLSSLIPSAEVLSADVLRLEPMLHEAREQIAAAKDAWLKATSGRGENLPRLKQTMVRLQEHASAIGNAALTRLIASLAARLDTMPNDIGDAVALEYATGLLFAENAFENYGKLGREFAQQVGEMLARIDDAQAGRPGGAAPVPLLDEMLKRAHERLLLANVCREVQANLRHMEQVLDNFFRDQTRRGELAALGSDSRQVRGALRMLGLDQADALLESCEREIESYAASASHVDDADLEILAESLSCLGFYIEAIEQQRPAPERLIAPLLARRSGERAVADVGQSVEQVEITPLDLEPFPADAQAGQAEGADAADDYAESAAAAPPPAISRETQRLLATNERELDAEFLDIYLTEAGEVLDSIAENRALLERDPTARDALRTVRRGFHTLKGSGRMVGLTDLGEIAYAVEKIQNRLLEEDRAATPAVLAMIALAEKSFRGWLAELRERGRVQPDPSALRSAIGAIEAQLAFEQERVRPSMLQPLDERAPLPELGSASIAEPLVVPFDGVAADDETAITEVFAEDGLAEPTAPAREDAIAEVAAGAKQETAQADVTIGDVTLSSALFDIVVAEAAQHLATLEDELHLMQTGASIAPSAAVVRASHTLCGIHRTAGFPLVAQTSKSLEQCLSALQQRGAPMPERAGAALAQAVSAVASLLGRVARREPFGEDDIAAALESQDALDTVRRECGVLALATDAESLAAREAAMEDMAAPAVEIGAAPAVDSGAAPAVGQMADAVDPGESGVPVVHDEIDPQLLPIFLDEAGELFSQVGESMRAWRDNPAATEAAHRLQRTLHTFKGSARMAGAMRLGDLTHRMESRLLDGESLAAATVSLFDALDGDLDQIGFMLDALRHGRSIEAPPQQPAEAPRQPAPFVPNVVPLPARPSVSASPIGAPWSAATESDTQRALLRVRADTIDLLVNEAGEMAITRARVESELRSLKANLLELTGSIIRLRTQMRQIEIQGETQIQSRMSTAGESNEGFDPLEFDRYTHFQELTRSLAEGVSDVATVQQSLLKNIDDAEVALLAQARLSREMQQQLFAIRTVPFGSLSERLYRILRQTAKELDKRANLEIRGAEVELDRSVLEKLVGPLEHLLRNALDHGIESRELRLRSGKSEIGEITLTVRQVGNEIAIELADDGAGLDLAQIRAKAQAQGRFAPEANPGDAQLIECIFMPGFTTVSRVTAVSGRGIGMDVVRAEIASLGGRVEVFTREGQGTTFQLYLPLTLAVAQAVLLRAAGRLWAIPAQMVEQVQQIKFETLRDHYEARFVEWQDKRYPFHYLPRLLGDNQHNPETSRYNPVLLLRTGQNTAAVHVDEVIGKQEVVIKNIGPQLARVSGIAGATVLGTGEIVLIINPVQLAQRSDISQFDPHAPDHITHGMRPPVAAAPLVMIVDDSLTVRKVMSRLLLREGFSVVTARDGADALQRLEEHMPDVILLDIEMPRLDGFEFTRTIKSMPRYAHIPIIVITSRTAEKHRTRARELGVDLYLGKPFQEEELLRNLREMLALTS